MVSQLGKDPDPGKALSQRDSKGETTVEAVPSCICDMHGGENDHIGEVEQWNTHIRSNTDAGCVGR